MEHIFLKFVFPFFIFHDVFLPPGQKAPNEKARNREHRGKRKKDRDSSVLGSWLGIRFTVHVHNENTNLLPSSFSLVVCAVFVVRMPCSASSKRARSGIRPVPACPDTN
jgi:hypothetical protein